MLKSSNDKNVTLIGTVMERLAVESLWMKIEMGKSLTSINPTAKSWTSESLSLKNQAVKILLETSCDKNSGGVTII